MELSRLPMSVLVAAAIPLSWLLSNHYLPWLSAWQEGTALALLLLAGLLARRDGRLPVAWLIAALLVLASSFTQLWLVDGTYSGDALMVALYTLALLLAVALGSSWTGEYPDLTRIAAETLAWGLIVAAVVSVLVALSQWAGGPSLPFFTVDLAPGGRPYGNLAQPNHLCTAAFLGLCSACLLRTIGRIGKVGWFALVLYLVLGMVITGSRTGWLQMGAWAAILIAARMRAREASTLTLGAVGAVLVAFGALSVAWPALTTALDLAGSRPATDLATHGTRPLHWLALWDAAQREFWWGHGWLRTGAAQWVVAADHPYTGEPLSFGHNLVIDLVSWAGVPMGLLIIGCVVWGGRQGGVVPDPGIKAAIVAALVGLLLHALVEFPLYYAYFLAPFGLLAGAALVTGSRSTLLRIPALAMRLAAAALALLLVPVALDYLKAESSHRQLRLETSRIGAPGLVSPPPDLRLLNQVEALLWLASTQATAGMTAEALRDMEAAARRWPFPPAMLRFALAAGLNGQPDAARETLVALCKVHPRERCEELRTAWQALQQRHPVLEAIAAPSAPAPAR